MSCVEGPGWRIFVPTISTRSALWVNLLHLILQAVATLCYIYEDSKSRLGLRKCTIPFSAAFHFISWAIKCEEEEEEEENHIVCYFVWV